MMPAAANFLSAVIILTPLTIFLLAIVPILDKTYSAFGRYYLWLLVVAGLWMPLFWFIPRLVIIDFPNIRAEIPYSPEITLPSDFREIIAGGFGENPSAFSAEFSAAVTIVYELSNAPANNARVVNITMVNIVLILWILGVVISVCIHTLNHIVFLRFVRQWSFDKNSPEIIDIFNAEKARLGIKKPVKLIGCKGIKAPMLLGFFRPMVIIPAPGTEPQLSDLPFIFRHELMHLKRHDLWYKLVLIATKCLHWFNPVVHLMARRADKDLETICDCLTVEGLCANERKLYSEIILNIAAARPGKQVPLTTYFVGGKNMLKQRFANILSKAKKHGAAVFVPLGLFIVFSGVFVGLDFSPFSPFSPFFPSSAEAAVYDENSSSHIFGAMSNLELAAWTLARNHGHCDYELAELKSRFYVIPGYEATLTRLAPLGLARRLVELESRHSLSNLELSDILLGSFPINDARYRNVLVSRLSYFDDTNVGDLSIRELALRLRDWEHFTTLLSLTPGVREILLSRLSRWYSRDELLHHDSFDLARRLQYREVGIW
ncbi:MAG: M56 family metallopeptidase [Defluviitaleaceae bacterium]|nr:M56 family metallopeptidase [Defluviitaleaceae bacterium]